MKKFLFMLLAIVVVNISVKSQVIAPQKSMKLTNINAQPKQVFKLTPKQKRSLAIVGVFSLVTLAKTTGVFDKTKKTFCIGMQFKF